MTILVFALVALAVCALLVLVHRWLWIRLVRDTTAPGARTRRIGTALTIALPLLSVAALTTGRAGAPFWLQQTVAWPGYLWLAVLLYLTLTMLVAEPIRALLLRRLAHRVPSGAVAGPPAPQTVPRAAAVAVGTVATGTYGVLRGPSVRRVQVPLAKLPRAAHGFRIAVVSDVHLGPVLGRAHTQRIVDTVNRTQPDLIAIVGDLVDGSVPDLGPAAEPLRRLSARHGSYFVTGNHEYFSGAQQWIDHVRELGLTPLENARRALPHFDLAGVNDIQGETEGKGPDFQAALGDRDRSRAAVLLAHQPVVIHDAVRHGVDLQLSGHTHGGQLWPGNYLAELANPTVAGLERYGDTQLYVSRGAGAWGPPVRVGAPSDITVVELASYQA
ncbi:metallophosphoesterase [Streptomyces sp. NRRL F-2580]|uniref:metallophosphoesterase n=1 Tax=Streptomyces sp. NRRL F-2580 TaxID=1463841 RepID=UPI0004C9F197|nr:metallophosphoesterase [Streptomyces sp. NRRL F-2580]